MTAAPIRALVLTVLLTAVVPVCLADASSEPAASRAATTEPVEDGSAVQALSTLGALSLGILGLLWVRRHTAEL